MSLETAPGRPPTLAGRPLTPFAFDRQGAGFLGKLGLTVVLTVRHGAMSGVLTYRGDRYRPADVARFATLLGRVMSTLPDRLHVPVGELDLVGSDLADLREAERGPAAAPATTVPELVARWCEEHPDAPAVETAGGVTSYRRLAQRATALAERIRPHLRGADPVVALVLGRGADLPVAMLASWQAGAAFCPIEPGHPSARVDFVLDDLDACAVLTDDPSLRERLGGTGRAVLDVTADEAGDPAAPVPPLRVPAPGSTAYVIHTSGTTGEPKGWRSATAASANLCCGDASPSTCGRATGSPRSSAPASTPRSGTSGRRSVREPAWYRWRARWSSPGLRAGWTNGGSRTAW